MEQQEHEIIKQAIQRDLGIELAGVFTEQEIIDKLALQIALISEKGPETFFQLMYRLDIPEKQLVNAMHDRQVATEIAKLVYNRQLQKMRSREYYKRKPGSDEDIAW